MTAWGLGDNILEDGNMLCHPGDVGKALAGSRGELGWVTGVS